VSLSKPNRVSVTEPPPVALSSRPSALPANDNAEFEHYDQTCTSYDETRAPIGVEIYLGVFARASRGLTSQIILDAGCGTGNYGAAIAAHVGGLYCVDRERGMLERARAKLSSAARTRFALASVVELPFQRESVDGVMLNQVAHHLEDPGSELRFERLASFFAQALTVLRPGGALVINTSTPEQVVRGYWWAELIPEAVAAIARRYPALTALDALLRAAGFATINSYVSLDGVLQARNYLDPKGPLKASWRAGDSTWSLASASELEAAQERVRTLLKTGGMPAYLAQRERERAAVGQTTFVCARKAR
jgi:SAM-dependent methyltransferase